MLQAHTFILDAVVKRKKRRYTLDFWLHLPGDYKTSRKRYPLVLFLHGSGERGNDINKVLKHGPPKLLKKGVDLPCILVAPQCPAGEWWTPHIPALMGLLDSVAETHRVNPRRVICTGLSMGGYGTWEMGVAFPKSFAALVPICGGGRREFGFPKVVQAVADVPVWAFHGAKDEIVPLSETLALTDRLRALDANPRVTVYPNLKHDSWTRAYNDPELWDWMWKQRAGGR